MYTNCCFFTLAKLGIADDTAKGFSLKREGKIPTAALSANGSLMRHLSSCIFIFTNTGLLKLLPALPPIADNSGESFGSMSG